MKRYIKLLIALFICSTIASQKQVIKPDKSWGKGSALIESISIDNIGEVMAKVDIMAVSKELSRVDVIYDLPSDVSQDEVEINIKPTFIPSFHWAPHLTPTDNHVIDQHVFRAPALLMQDGKSTLIIMPAMDNEYTGKPYRFYMDMDAERQVMTLGMGKTKITDHVLYEKEQGAIFPKGKNCISFYIMASSDKSLLTNPFRAISGFYWREQGQSYYEKMSFPTSLYDKYCDYTYNWAFNGWRKAVWQEFDIKGKHVGAPVFIVDVTQSPNYPARNDYREDCSIWNQAWFSSLRSASGLYRYASRTGVDSLRKKALLSKELALSAPKKNGLFYSVIATPMEVVNVDGKDYSQSKGWKNYYWGNSNRNPVTWDLDKSPFHILDMSWTACMMLQWYEELERDERLIEYVTDYAEALLKLQDTKGYFPAWLDIETLEVLPYLTDSPESSLSALFLLKLYNITGKEKYKTSALKALDVVVKDIVPAGRWEDFETYWSCCRYGSDYLPGHKVVRNNMYKQCNFSMFWTADALLEAYHFTKNKRYLDKGQRVLDEMLMTQSVWQPPHIYVDAIGGFGVLNSDGEWNDARGSLFAELLLKYGKETKNEEYTGRGLLALKAAFSMIYCPENTKTKHLWEITWPFFSTQDYGFLMENYGHAGATSPEGEGMGNFTIYDWGNGAASEAYNRILDRWGKSLFEK